MLELGFIFHFFSLSYSPLSIVLMCDGKATRRQFTSPIYLSIIVLSRREFFIVVKFCSSFNPLNLTASTTIKCLHHNWLMMFNQPNYSSPYGRPSIHPTIHPLLVSLPFFMYSHRIAPTFAPIKKLQSLSIRINSYEEHARRGVDGKTFK